MIGFIKNILILVSILFISQSRSVLAAEPRQEGSDHLKIFRETGELKDFRVIKEIVIKCEGRSPYADKDYKNAFELVKNFEKIEKSSYNKKYKKTERASIYEIIRILLCDHKGSVVSRGDREIDLPLLCDETLKEGGHQGPNTFQSTGGIRLERLYINPFKVQACEKKLKTLLPNARLSYGEVDFKLAIDLASISPVEDKSVTIRSDNSVLHTYDLSGCTIIMLHVKRDHPLNPIGIMAHVSPALQDGANKNIQRIIELARENHGVSLVDAKPTVSVISGHISDYLLNYCEVLKNAGLSPQYVYYGLSMYEEGEKQRCEGTLLTQANYYSRGFCDAGGRVVDDVERGVAPNTLSYPRAVTFDVQSGEISTLAIKDKNAKLIE